MPAERMSLFEELDAVGDDFHQTGKGGARQRDAQAAEQQQQRPGRAQDRIFIGRDQFVDGDLGRLRGRRRLRRCSRVTIHSSGLGFPGALGGT